MAETTVLRSTAQAKNANPTSANPKAQLSGPHPLVNVTMGSGGPSVGSQQSAPHRKVEILEKSAMGMRPGPGTAAGMKRVAQVASKNGAPPSPVATAQAAVVPTTGMPTATPLANAGMRPANVVQIGSRAPAQAALATGALTLDQLMLLRHLTDSFVRDIDPAHPEAGLAAMTLATLDQLLQASAAANASAAAASSAPTQVRTGTPPPVVVQSARQQASVANSPRRFQRPAAAPPVPPAERPPIDVTAPEVATDASGDVPAAG